MGTVQRPGYHLAREFTVSGTPERAVLHVTAHGLYEAFINDARVGELELTPGFTAYRKRLQVQAFEVTHLLREGDNCLGVLLSDGWWRGQTGAGRRTNSFGPTVAVLAELHVTVAGAESVAVYTDGSWLCTTGHLLAADLIAGERHDLRLRIPGWAAPGSDRSGWQPVHEAEHPYEVLCATTGPPVKRMQELPAVSVREVRPGRHLVDFGQNSNGWIRLTDLGPAGTELTIVHGEALNPEGDDVSIESLAGTAVELDRGYPLTFQTDVVISAGDGSAFEPRHSTKGFRYVRVDGHPGPLDAASLTSIVVRDELRQVGGFSCSNDDLNALHRAAEWSLLTNACEVPTDCPTRERSGWTGDWQIYVATAAYLYDVLDFSRKWLADLAADQLPNGAVTHYVPDAADLSLEAVRWWADLQGSAGWGDAAVHVPWELYRATGDVDVLRAQFDSMQRWVDFGAARAAATRHPDRVAKRAEAPPHEQYIWDTGFHFGEWNDPSQKAERSDDDEGGIQDFLKRLLSADHGPTATAFLHRSAAELAQVATLLGEQEAADRYAALAGSALEAWRLEFIDDDGHLRPQTQANLVRALAFGLVPTELREQAAADLVALVRAAGTHLGTGFLATPFLLPVLADHGHLDVAYELLLQRSRPSWLAMLDAGATTIWENWDSVTPDGRVWSSLNHFSMGAVISFLHHYTAGLRLLEPGYRRFRVEPRPGGGITSAATHHDSPHGRIEVAWRLDLGKGVLDLKVPGGTEAELVLPGAEPELLGPGQHQREWK